MPFSETALRPWIAVTLRSHARHVASFRFVTDTGAGAGTARQFYDQLMPSASWTAIEIHEPYRARFRLDELYDTVLIADARDLEPWPKADLCLMADVAEHMKPDEAVAVWDKARAASRWLVLTMPVVPYPQGEAFGNPHEAHLHDWDVPSVLESFGGILAHSDHLPGLAAGAFVARGMLP